VVPVRPGVALEALVVVPARRRVALEALQVVVPARLRVVLAALQVAGLAVALRVAQAALEVVVSELQPALAGLGLGGQRVVLVPEAGMVAKCVMSAGDGP
jgi:hypothetical protein